jgi:hypothetical protein
MKSRQIWLEMPHTYIDISIIPAGFIQQFPMFAGDEADLGLENLGLSKSEYGALVLACIRGDGVRIPGSPYRLRQSNRLVIEPHTGGEPVLPEHWLQGAWVRHQDAYLWIGASVRIGGEIGDQIAGDFDFAPYTRLTDGWMLTAAIP